LRHAHALHAAGEALEALDQRRRRDRQRQGDQRQVRPPQAQRRHPEGEAEREGEQRGGGQGQQVRQVRLGDQRRRGVRADGEEGAVAEGDLPAVADQQVEPQRRHGVDQHQRQLPDDHPVAVERDAGRDQHHRGERRRAQRPVAPAAGLDPEGAHP
jgi:hypothetical protein